MEERLLGFDLRVPDPRPLWDTDRRELYLLRVDVPCPLSVDTLVWPSLFDTGQGIGLVQSERERWHLAGIPLPAWTGPNASLWDDLERMQQYLIAHEPQPRSQVGVAVSWCSDRNFTEAGQVAPYLTPVNPPIPADSWQRLGFDVADGSLVSALANCGYSEVEVAGLRSQWRDRLNDRHLFDDLDHAFQFKHLSDQRVPEHAPFSVYGLFLIEYNQ